MRTSLRRCDLSRLVPTLDPAAWATRHRWIVRLLWFHIVPVITVAVVNSHSLAHGVTESVPIVALALLADRGARSHGVRSVLASAGLMYSSAVLVHLTGGVTEVHFHFFVMLGVISLYQEGWPFLLSIAFVAGHHAVFGAIAPQDVYNHPAAWRSPLLWAGIHAFFVLAACAVSVASWSIIENSNRAARRALLARERQFRSIIEHNNDVVTLFRSDGTVLYDSPSMERLFGHRPMDRIGSNGFDLVHPDDLEHALAALGRVLAAPRAVGQIELRLRRADGTYVWVDGSATNLLDDPDVAAVVGNFREITERKQLEEELSHHAFHDSLTGLPNRALLVDRVEQALKRSTRDTDARVALLFLDLDDFKTVNDGLGHHAGDAILRHTAERIRSILRPGDTAARLGGDEFAVLLERVPADPSPVYEIGTRLLEAVCTPIDVDGSLVAVHASLGIVVGDGADDGATLLRNADLAMYRAKSSGKGRYEVYEAGMHAAVVERMALKADLVRAVEAGEFEPHYQPIVDLMSGAVSGVEALARWNHPEKGLVCPAAFIPLAEETGLIVAIGEQLLERACADLARWRADRPERAPMTLSVNLSARQLQHPDIVEQVRHALDVHDLPSSALTLELTESVLFENTDAVSTTLQALKELGIAIALDDFGTGYSSLSYLDRFPVDIVKIDKSFIDSLADSGLAPSPLVSAIVHLGSVLGLGVTAEGIEEREQLDRLRAMGCRQGQGFLFAPPMAAAAIEQLFEGGDAHGATAPIAASR